ncbi:InlB B-repeat-containing protein [Vescimonas sp.]|uniref:InlB B-repeat-containing protein n=1 Tax=Vescimonas sp. TaxID=2892404 RepID=UPI003F7D6E78
MKRRIVSVLMALVMALSLLPVQALAEDAAVGEPVTEIEQAEQIGEGKEPGDPAEQTGEGEEPGDPEEQTGEGEEPGDPEEGQEPGEPEEPVREFVQGEAQLTVSTAAMAAGTAGERTVPGNIYEALNVGGSLTMQNDVDYGGSMSVGVNLTIDLNGYVLKMTGIKVENGAHLTIKDSRPDAEHKFTPNTDGLWVLDETNGTKTVKGGVIYGGTGSSNGTSVYGGGVYVVGGGRFTMESGNIVGCTASTTFQARGGGVFVAEKGTFTMSGGSIAGCTTVGGYSYGGGIYNEGTVNLSGTAEIRDCHAKDSDGETAFGGGISDNGEAFQISGNVRITGCTASGGGTDAVSMDTGSVISGGTFDGSVQNTGTISGGTFNGRVVNSKMITDGIFNGEVVNDYGTISGGTFNGVVTNYSTITEGAISGITVTYQVNGAHYATQIVPSGSAAIKPVDLAKPGYSFDGWYTSDGAQWNFATAVTENITLTARWTLKAQEVSNEQELTAALADSANGVVRLTADITITAGLKIQHNVTVDLNGHVLRYDETANPGSIFRVTSDCTLTLTDSRPAAEHTDTTLPAGGLITGGKGFKYDNGAGQSYTYYGGGVYVETGASFVLAGGTIYACGVQSGANSAYGGGIYAEGGSVTMSGGAIRSCAVSADYGASGGAIYAKAGSVTMSGGVISGCSAKDGGGILTSGCTVRITGGRIENCKASERGGGLYIGDHADQVSVLDAAISGCEAKRGGGVALMGFAELELGENARITGCTATEKDDTEAGAIEYGAAIYMDLDSTFTVNYPGNFLYANGGRVEGTVYVGTNKIGSKNNYLDSVKATNAIDHTDGKPTTVFTGDVYCEGDIRGGIFHGSVTVTDSNGNMADTSKYNYWKFCSNLSGGSFYKPVRTECHVSGGTFYDELTREKNAKLSGKPVNTGTVINDKTNIPNPDGKPVTVTYAYGALGGTYATQIVQTGEKAIEPDVPSRQGYQFTDWYLDDTKYDFAAPVTGDMTLTAKWTANSYTITFDTDGGSAIDPITQGYGTTIKAPTAPTKTGYTFMGWNPALPATMPAENITVTAQWRINQYTITFDTDGGSAVDAQTVAYGEKAKTPADPTKTGYTFAGWELGGNAYDFAAAVTGNMTLTAKWKDSEKPTGEIKISKNSWKSFLNNITFGLFFKDTQTVTINAADNSGEAVTVEYLLSNKELTKTALDGMTFTAYTAPFSIASDNEYIIYVRLTDKAGNTDYICSDGIVLDGTSPVIKGIENGKTYCKAQTVTINEKYVDTVTVNGTAVTLNENGGFTLAPANGGQRIVVTDKAGNTAEMTVTVNDGHTYGDWVSNGDGTHTRQCTVDGCTGSETKDCSGGTATCTEKAKCSVCGAGYGDLNPAHHANLVNVPAKAATTSAEGNIEYWHCGGCGKYYKDAAAQDEIKQEDTVIAKRRVYYAPSLYPVRNGTNPPSGTEYPGGVYGLIFRAAVSGITGVQVDGRTVGRGSYTVEGSYPVELYLKASYLNRLAKGGHTLTVLTDSGSLTAAFTVGSGKSSPTTFDAGITVYAAAAVTSLTGLELLRRRRKEEE